MVRIVGVQGSPRKCRNTETLLRHAFAATEEAGGRGGGRTETVKRW